MWQIWFLIIIILLIAFYRYPSSLIFSFFITSIAIHFLSFILHNLLLECLLFTSVSLIIQTIINRVHLHLSHNRFNNTINSNILINQTGIITKTINNSFLGSGLIRLNNETWCTIASSRIPKGTIVKVIAINGLRLTVTPLDSSSPK